MGTHPANLALRFVLELATLGILGWWGYRVGDGAVRWMLAFGLPLVAAMLWGVFAVPDDPSRSGKTVVVTAGWVRLLGELAFFGAAVAALLHQGVRAYGLGLAAVVVLHYLASYDRVAWLLRH